MCLCFKWAKSKSVHLFKRYDATEKHTHADINKHPSFLSRVLKILSEIKIFGSKQSFQHYNFNIASITYQTSTIIANTTDCCIRRSKLVPIQYCSAHNRCFSVRNSTTSPAHHEFLCVILYHSRLFNFVTFTDIVRLYLNLKYPWQSI